MPCMWSINAIRRALARLSQTWVNRLQHPEQAVASIQLSRENSVDDMTAQTDLASKIHSRQPSFAENIDTHNVEAHNTEGLEARASELKVLVGSILSGTDESRSPVASGFPRQENASEAFGNSLLPGHRSQSTRQTVLSVASPPLPSPLGQESLHASEGKSDHSDSMRRDRSPFLARSLASEEKGSDSEDDVSEILTTRARRLDKSFTAPVNKYMSDTSRPLLSPTRMVSLFQNKANSRSDTETLLWGSVLYSFTVSVTHASLWQCCLQWLQYW